MTICSRTAWVAALPRCKDGHPMEYVADLNRWLCPRDGNEVRGEVVAREAGFDTTMHFAAEAA